MSTMKHILSIAALLAVVVAPAVHAGGDSGVWILPGRGGPGMGDGSDDETALASGGSETGGLLPRRSAGSLGDWAAHALPQTASGVVVGDARESLLVVEFRRGGNRWGVTVPVSAGQVRLLPILVRVRQVVGPDGDVRVGVLAADRLGVQQTWMIHRSQARQVEILQRR